MIKPALNVIRSANWSRVGGPLLTAATAGALALLASHGFSPQGSSSMLVLVVAFSAFAGGLRPGLTSAGIAWIYFALAFSRQGHPFRYDPDDLERLVVLAAITPAIVIMVGVLHRRSTDQFAAQLLESEQRFKAFMDNSPTVAWIKDDQGRYIYVNAPYELTFNVRHGDLVGKSGPEPWTSDTARQLAENDRAVLESGKPRQLYETLSGADKVRQHWWLLQFPVDAGAGQRFIGGMAVDITERKQAEEALRASEERYALAAQSVNDGLWDWNLKTNEVYYSERWKAMLGCEGEDIGNTPFEWFRRVHPDDLAQVQSLLQDHLEGRSPTFESEHRMRHKDRGYRWVLSRGLAVRNGSGRAYRMVGAQSDTTQRKLAEEQLIHDALHDALTGLPNRTLFVDRLSHRIRHSRREKDRLFGVLFLDLDRFKLVNDSMGHSAGDQLLVETSRRLEQAVRPGDTVARLGGDEFAVLLEDVTEPGDAVRVAERIQTSLKNPIKLENQEVVSTASIGIAMSQTGYEKAEDVLRDADTAMYRAKSEGRARHEVFDSAMHARAVSLLKIENELRQAIEREEFRVFYMPIVSLATGRIDGFEALVRWQHPERGLVSPFDFMGVAEDAGLIIAIDRWVLRRACHEVRTWQQKYPDGDRLTVSVNLSAKQFHHSDLVDTIRGAITDSGLPGESLGIEITEGVLIDNTSTAGAMLGEMRKLGARIYLDDFGTGYSSLSYLQRFPIDAVKIDRSFVSRLGPKAEGHEIVQAIVTLAHNLGMRVIAEGIESSDQLALLRRLKCGYGQGWLFSKPIPHEEASELLLQETRW
ncbi:MAG TPA: EAL domain-containing protein [Planctomycetota bacterium]|nr:EAL domain-containing protein [Planctomycetota bacterium]